MMDHTQSGAEYAGNRSDEKNDLTLFPAHTPSRAAAAPQTPREVKRAYPDDMLL